MTTIGPSPLRRLQITQRQLYFFILWLPMLLVFVFFIYSAIFHLPFAAVHGWNARKKSTQRLINESWKVPFKVAFVCLLAIAGSVLYDAVFTERPFAWDIVWRWCIVFPGTGFAASTLLVGLGRLLLITVAARWPCDRVDAASR